MYSMDVMKQYKAIYIQMAIRKRSSEGAKVQRGDGRQGWRGLELGKERLEGMCAREYGSERGRKYDTSINLIRHKIAFSNLYNFMYV